MKNKILVVEDTISDVIFLKKILEKENYEIIYAENGKDALQLLETHTPDLVILDILLPDIDGFEVCRRIRQNERLVYLPVLFYSVVKTVDEKLIALEMGASDFLSKSGDSRELLIRIKNLLQVKKKIDEIIDFSFYDRLTKVYNLKYFQHRLEDEYERSKRYNRNFSCAIIDIDNFKIINENFGYLTGDRVLKKVAEIVRQNVRNMDEVCRCGQDEFGILFPETDARDAYFSTERIRRIITMSNLKEANWPTNLSISCGVSAFNKDVKGIDELLAQASFALRRAKLEGHNQTQTYSPQLGTTYLGQQV